MSVDWGPNLSMWQGRWPQSAQAESCIEVRENVEEAGEQGVQMQHRETSSANVAEKSIVCLRLRGTQNSNTLVDLYDAHTRTLAKRPAESPRLSWSFECWNQGLNQNGASLHQWFCGDPLPHTVNHAPRMAPRSLLWVLWKQHIPYVLNVLHCTTNIEYKRRSCYPSVAFSDHCIRLTVLLPTLFLTAHPRQCQRLWLDPNAL